MDLQGYALVVGILLAVSGMLLYVARRPRASSRRSVIGMVIDRGAMEPRDGDRYPQWWLTVEWSDKDGSRHRKNFLVDYPGFNANPEGTSVEVTLLDPSRPQRANLATVNTYGGDPMYTLPKVLTTLGVALLWAALFLPEP